MSTFALLRIVGWGQLDGLGMADPAQALRALGRRTRTTADAQRLLSVSTALAGNRGQIGEIAGLLAAYGVPPSPVAGLFYAGDEAARPQFAAMEQAVVSGRDGSEQARDGVVFWHLWRGEPVPPVEARRYLARLDRQQGDLGAAASACLAAVRVGDADASARMRRADSLADLVPSADRVGSGAYVLARCHEAAGDRRGALAMLARRPLDAVYGPRFLAGMLYDEGRLALLEGDGPRALRAWRRLLTLRDDPDTALRPQVAAVRRVVDSLSRK